MTGRLYIMRHGEAAPGYPDSERELTARGRGEAERMARWLGARVAKGARLYVSPYVRARQTALPLAEALGAEPEVLPIITPDDAPEAVCVWLLANADEAPIVLVSHMPLVGLLTGLLVEGRGDHGLAFPTAAVVELDSTVWAAGCARLHRFTTPADLR
ncbi:phosphohistidine phosphatase SixA [Halomonas sp. MCCC 1A11036]|uniref:Phosphohistidine phosphatase SixA n=1 Tax=Billgrantia zhangzhouensis TaxID=2733481 RepID=A0ABS9AFW9_9GAMM|nr:phosphohistidine phosphatase SixA [Halomonas zhangzhouensis]MCE8020617.1 phosphohistidine phosphatase SixA [Halomonas zhangzhouensis]